MPGGAAVHQNKQVARYESVLLLALGLFRLVDGCIVGVDLRLRRPVRRCRAGAGAATE